MTTYPLAGKYGFHTPKGSDYISKGDDEISFNAERAGYWLDYVQARSMSLREELTVSLNAMAKPTYLGMHSFTAESDAAAPANFKGRCSVMQSFDGFTYVQVVTERTTARRAHRTYDPALPGWTPWQEQSKPGPLGQMLDSVAAAASTPTSIVVLGDSNTEGMGATTLEDRWITRLQEILNRQGAAPTGARFPFIPAAYNNAVPGQPVTRSGNVAVGTSNFGFGWRAGHLADDTGVVTFTFTGTSAKLMLVTGSAGGVAKISVNSAPPYTINTYNAAGTAPKLFPVEGLSSGSNTVAVQRDVSSMPGRQIFLEGLLTYNSDETRGVRVIDAGFSGRKAADVTPTRAANFARDVALLPDCRLVLINLLTNDVTAATTPATYKTNLATLISQLRSTGYSGPIAFLTPAKGATQERDAIAGYVRILAELARDYPNVLLIDTGVQLPEITSSRTNISELGYYADSLHFSTAGHQAMSGTVHTGLETYR